MGKYLLCLIVLSMDHATTMLPHDLLVRGSSENYLPKCIHWLCHIQLNRALYCLCFLCLRSIPNTFGFVHQGLIDKTHCFHYYKICLFWAIRNTRCLLYLFICIYSRWLRFNGAHTLITLLMVLEKIDKNSMYLNAPTHSWPSLWTESPGDVTPNFGLPLIPKYSIANGWKQ